MKNLNKLVDTTKETQEKINNYWEKLKDTNINWLIKTFKVVKVIGWVCSAVSLVWPLLPWTKTKNYQDSPVPLIFSLASFLIMSLADGVNDLFFKPYKEKLLIENIIKMQESKKEKEKKI